MKQDKLSVPVNSLIDGDNPELIEFWINSGIDTVANLVDKVELVSSLQKLNKAMTDYAFSHEHPDTSETTKIAEAHLILGVKLMKVHDQAKFYNQSLELLKKNNIQIKQPNIGRQLATTLGYS